MADNYFYHLNQYDDDTYTWNIIETQTNQTIVKFIFEDDAISLTEHLNDGGGFDGFTPSFFLKP